MGDPHLMIFVENKNLILKEITFVEFLHRAVMLEGYLTLDLVGLERNQQQHKLIVIVIIIIITLVILLPRS
jgi:hypothetical protein